MDKRCKFLVLSKRVGYNITERGKVGTHAGSGTAKVYLGDLAKETGVGIIEKHKKQDDWYILIL